MVTWHSSHVTNKKSYIFASAWLMTTKLDKVMAYGIGPPCTKSHDYLILWLYVVSWQNKKWTRNLWTPNGHQTWRGSGLLHGTNTQNVTSLLVKSSFHSGTFSYLRIVPLILHRATTRLLLWLWEKELSILKFLNLHVTLNEIHGSI